MELLMKMPDLSTTDSAIKLIRWLVLPGQSVKRGQALCEIETDKAASEVESIVTGVLKEVRARPGDMVVVGQELALFETEAPLTSTPPAASTPVKASGLFARNRAAAPATSQSPAITLSQSQQTLGRRLQSSKQTIPHFYLQASANAEPMIRRRNATSPKRLNAEGVSVSPNSDIGVAVDVKGDLFVAAVSTNPASTVEQISDEIRARVREIQEGAGEARGIRPAAITVTNLGATQVESFAAIINPPEAAILAIGKIGPVPVVHEGRVAVQHRVALTLSADHRVINGKYAADFMGAIIREIEAF
jgi:pyruvate dehydrogenase E2 component (dihydrolipoamide acetyltransferase)